MARSSKDLAKRLRFDLRPRPDAFRRWYLGLALTACAIGAAAWWLLGRATGERQYLPGPVSAAHATFGDRCAHCHVAFASAPDEKCLACHAPRIHSQFELNPPACRDCHVEHQGSAGLLTIGNQSCVGCHGALHSNRKPAIAVDIVDFAGHPEFVPLRAGTRDPAALRFNHQLHLDRDKVRDNGRQPPGPLVCADCHLPDAAGRFMAPIRFEAHCQRCHELKVTASDIPAPLNQIEAPHAAPDAVRTGLEQALLVMGAQRASEIFAGEAGVLIPGRVGRGPIDDSKSLLEFQRKWLVALERHLYAPFDPTPPLLESNKHCFLCHLQGDGVGDGGLPRVVDAAIPNPWLHHAVFSHRAHDALPCEACHAGIATSALTDDVNLPSRVVCAQCHADGRQQSAGTDCTLCHLYHDTSKDPAAAAGRRPKRTVDELLGRPEQRAPAH